MKKYLEKFNLTVKNVSIVNNFLANGQYVLQPRIKVGVGKSLDDENTYTVEMSVNITNTPEHPFPMDVSITMVGFFKFKGGEHDQIINWLRVEGANKVYPEFVKCVHAITAPVMKPAVSLPSKAPFA